MAHMEAVSQPLLDRDEMGEASSPFFCVVPREPNAQGRRDLGRRGLRDILYDLGIPLDEFLSAL